MEKIILIGGGGHCISILDTLMTSKEYEIEGIVDIKDNIGKTVLDVPIISDDSGLEELYSKGIKKAFISLGNIGSPKKRIEIYNNLKRLGYELPVIVDETSNISKYAIISEGVFVGKNVIINAGAKIGKGSIINTGVIVEHECIIGDFVHLSPGVVLSGKTIIEENVHIGTNSTVINGIRIKSNTLVGAGSVVVKDLDSNIKAFGNPCKVKSKL